MRGDPPLSIIGVLENAIYSPYRAKFASYTPSPLLEDDSTLILLARIAAIFILAAALVLLPVAIFDALKLSETKFAESKLRARETQATIRVGVMRHPTVFYIDANGEPAGLEYDLASAFTVTQRSQAEWKLFATPEEAMSALERGELDFVAMGTSAPPPNAASLPYIATQTRYRESGWILLHSPKKFQPKSFAELLPRRVVVSSRIVSHPRFLEIAQKNPKIEFVPDLKHDDESLMAAVGDDELEYAIVEEDTFTSSRHFHYDTQRAFVVSPAQSRAWFFAPSQTALRDVADAFLKRIVRDGQIARVIDKYFGFPGARKQEEFEVFTERVNSVLPRYRNWFHEAQERHGVEWRLLAAVAYQESHWNADATSETGVRGIMQFTEDTAKRYGVDRLDPYSSIIGAARYIAELKRDALAARINEPDKTWLALAAYNIGIGHVENARILTQRSKKNPDSWVDVRRHLPLLTNPDIASQFKLGTCRCGMPVDFVESVRAYYDVLLRLETPHQPRLKVLEKT